MAWWLCSQQARCINRMFMQLANTLKGLAQRLHAQSSSHGICCTSELVGANMIHSFPECAWFCNAFEDANTMHNQLMQKRL